MAITCWNKKIEEIRAVTALFLTAILSFFFTADISLSPLANREKSILISNANQPNASRQKAPKLACLKHTPNIREDNRKIYCYIGNYFWLLMYEAAENRKNKSIDAAFCFPGNNKQDAAKQQWRET